ncbi:YbaN family protein [Bacillus sp. CGMCC 1.16607]|uniref:YbaN family protein n=1 Tax=Bacillus sp. CGMCC 1.16607 TaxID=3351842 RepID=UPI003634D679
MKGLLKPLLIFLGSLFVILGVIGIVVPLIPTTPFLLLAAFCYARSSERMHRWLLNTKWLGAYIKSFQSGEGIPPKVKYTAILVLWISSSYSIFFIIPLVWVRIVILLIVIYITYYIWSIPNKEKTNVKFNKGRS